MSVKDYIDANRKLIVNHRNWIDEFLNSSPVDMYYLIHEADENFIDALRAMIENVHLNTPKDDTDKKTVYSTQGDRIKKLYNSATTELARGHMKKLFFGDNTKPELIIEFIKKNKNSFI